MIPLVIRLFGLAKGLPRWVYGVMAAVAALGLLWALHGHWERSAYNKAFNAGYAVQKVLTDREIAKNAINLKSIGDLQGIIADKDEETRLRGIAFANAKAADAKAVADADRRYQSTAARVASLEAIARVPGGNPACRTPRAVTDALEGL